MQKHQIKKMKINFLNIICCLPLFTLAQNFEYQAEIVDLQGKWQEINLNEDVLSKVNTDLSDIRIYEYSEGKDTLEVPYLIKSLESQYSARGVNFKLLNQVYKGDDLYFTFQTINDLEVNEIILNLNQDNYNYNIDIEAGNDQKEWFELVKDYRILSIKNKLTNYQFTKISFPNTAYKYYRVRIKNAKKASLKSASMKQKVSIEGKYTTYDNVLKQEEKNKNTILTIDLKNRVPVSQCKLIVNTEHDYYRPIKIKYLTDSVKTDKGWYYNYASISNEYLSSLETSAYQFETVFTNKLKIEISNFDNQALDVTNAEIKGPDFQIIARFSEENTSSYMLLGNSSIRKPQYDLVNFKDNIPQDINQAKVGNIINLKEQKQESTFLNNKLWLWAIIIIIIAILAYSSLGMLKKKS